MIKKRNLTTINFSDSAINSLQIAGYMDKNKKSKGRNLSGYISRLVLNNVKVKYPLDYKQIRERVKVLELVELQRQRNKLDRQILKKAEELKKVREKLKK